MTNTQRTSNTNATDNETKDEAAPSCCGGPAPADAAACCAKDAAAKAAGEAGCGCGPKAGTKKSCC
jgi:hypothetical protein